MILIKASLFEVRRFGFSSFDTSVFYLRRPWTWPIWLIFCLPIFLPHKITHHGVWKPWRCPNHSYWLMDKTHRWAGFCPSTVCIGLSLICPPKKTPGPNFGSCSWVSSTKKNGPQRNCFFFRMDFKRFFCTHPPIFFGFKKTRCKLKSSMKLPINPQKKKQRWKSTPPEKVC